MAPDPQLLRATAGVMAALSALVLASALLAEPVRLWTALASAFGLLACVVGLGANAAGHRRGAAIGLSVFALIGVSIGNIGAPGASGFIVAALIAGLLLGPKAAAGFAAAGCAILTAITAATGNPSVGGWTGQVALLLGGAALTALVSDRVLSSLAREHQAASRYRTLIEHQPLGVFAVGLDLRVEVANEAFVRLMGYEKVEDVVGTDLRETHAYQIQEIRELIHRVLEGEHVVGEIAFTALTGKPVAFRVHGAPLRDEAGRVVGGQASCEDYSAEIAAEQALSESEGRFRAISESDTDLVTEIREDDHHVFVSPNVTRLFGHSPEEILARKPTDLLHPEDLGSIVAAMSRVRRSGKPEQIEFRLRDAWGAWRAVESSLSPFRTAGGEVHLLAVSRDVTQRRRLEEDLRHAHKMQAVGQLAAGVAHDFNNLLTVIQGRAELLVESGGSEDQRESANEILAASERAAALTRQLLTFSRKQPVEVRLIELDETIRGLEDMLRRLLGEHIELSFDLAAPGAHVRGDPASIEQVVVNLALNARDAMPDGGQLGIETRREPLADARDAVSITVSDTGVGVDPGSRDRIFEPFFTTKAVGEGTGMGLATTYAIVEQLGGEIGFDSTPGRGSRFRVQVPCARAARAVDRTERREPKGPEPTGATILLVEDEAPVRAVSKAILEGAGHRVVTAGDGDQALELARSKPEIDLVVTDLVMPRRSGASLASELRTVRPELPVITMSGYMPRPDVPLDGPLLHKPFTGDELRSAVNELLASELGSEPGSEPGSESGSELGSEASAEHPA
ncbi:MAG: PAS domain S-box protein [Myxococcota bacterium]|nr:PAS domain S-box protein [Myxococcota bacterium]